MLSKKYTLLAESADMRIMDKITVDELGITSEELMNKASKAFFDDLLKSDIIKNVQSVLILCGSGNNGGDGLAVALFLKEAGFSVGIFKTFAGEFKSEDSRFYYDKVTEDSDIGITEDIKKLSVLLKKSDMVIDAVFGTGFKGEFNPELCAIMEKVNKADIKKVSIDVPSGINCDDGSVCEKAFKADMTITFEFLKLGTVSYPAVEYCGKNSVVKIGFPENARKYLYSKKNSPVLLDAKIIFNNLKKREANTHKGTYGNLLAVCGSDNMTGAAYLSAMGALRCGVGLLYLACPEKILRVMQAKLNEPVFMPYNDEEETGFEKTVKNLDRFGAVLFGCGTGLNKNTSNILACLLENTKTSLILDADGINALAENINIKNGINILTGEPPEEKVSQPLRWEFPISSVPKSPASNFGALNNKKCGLILTPHPLEMARLINKDVKYVQSNRIKAAKEFALKYNCHVVLKGAATIIASCDGRTAVNSSGNPGLAKGGSGDVLAGMIASYAAQGYELFTAACMAVYLHGLAGDLCAEETSQNGMLPSDLESKIMLLQDAKKLKEYIPRE